MHCDNRSNYTLFSGGALSNTLREVSVPVFDTTKCKAQYEKTPKTYTITDNMICTYEQGKDACQVSANV